MLLSNLVDTELYHLAVFLGSLILMCVSSYVLTTYLERIGEWLGFSEGLLGILTALGADAPEIASAITALMAGHQELGVGVVIGSNIFNIAVLLGLSSVIAGVIRPGREGLILDGGVAMAVTLIGAALIGGYLPPWLGGLLLVLLLVPYVWITSLYPTNIKRMKFPLPLRKFLTVALADVRDDSKKSQTQPKASLLDILVILPALFAIVVGSEALVNTTVWLATRFSLPHATVGMLFIAALTGIPNAIAAVHLALHRRGAAVVTETFNSNTLNMVAGVTLPALFVGLGAISTRTIFSLCWLFCISVIAMAFAIKKDGIRRLGGTVLLALYGVGLIYFLGSALWREGSDLWNNFPSYMDNLSGWLGKLRQQFPQIPSDHDLSATVQKEVGQLGDYLWKTTSAVLGVLGGIGSALTVLVFTFYMLLERETIRSSFLMLIPPDHQKRVSEATTEALLTMGGWLRGQTILALAMMAIISLAMSALGVPRPILLGILGGVGELIPMVGPIVAAVVAVPLAYFTMPLWVAIVTLVFFVALSTIEGNFIVPKVMQKSVELSPFFTVLAVLIGVTLAGLLGALLSIPVAAALRVYLKRLVVPAIQRRKSSVLKPHGSGNRPRSP